jgi:hypothetical protein
MIRDGVPALHVIRDALNRAIAERDRLREDLDTLRAASDAVLRCWNDDLRRVRAERDRLRAALERIGRGYDTAASATARAALASHDDAKGATT